MRRAASRTVCAAFCVLTAAYAFTSASAFTYQELIRPRMFGAGVFSEWHALIYWPWLALTLVDLRRSFRQPGASRAWAWGFAIVWTMVGVGIAFKPVLPALADDRASLIVGALSLLPLVWAAALDHLRALEYLRRQPAPIDAARRAALEGRWLCGAMASAAFITIASAALASTAMRGAFEPDLLTAGLSAGLAANAVDHGVIFAGAFLTLAVCARVVGGRSFATQYAVTAVLIGAAFSLIVHRSICAALNLEGWGGVLVALSCGAAIVSTWSAVRLRTSEAGNQRLESPLDLFFSPPAQPGPWSATYAVRQVAAFLILALVMWGFAALSRMIDWDFLLLKTGVFLVWLAVVQRVLRLTPPVPVSNGWLALACASPLALHAAVDVAEASADGPDFSLKRVVDRYAIYNPAFRLADGLLRPRLSSSGDTAFLRFVRANTDFGIAVQPPSLDFVAPLTAAPRAPHVFLFVVDSLRPDYLAPYNPAVTFTPRIAEFAADSLVFRNTFTRYGGTGLSLPAIWMGAVGLHKQYVQPFWPMNTLEKLLTANHYREVMGVDVIMEQLLRPAAPPIELDRGIRTMDYRICRTLEELETKLPLPAGGNAPPVFGYSLPQDLHVSNIMNASVPAGESYPGFHAPYAARVRAIDRCFGTFVDFLKRHDLYEDSIIVLTSDHGEMLGEEGRWGHAYYLFPAILQVPLVMHLPRDIRRDAAADPTAISFLTDISPTLYAALGYRTRAGNRLMGEPLLGADRADPAARRRGDYVAAASYAAVYAVIRRNGRLVYIVDAVKSEEYAYERDRSDAWRRIDVTAGLRLTGRRLIREHLDEVRRVYRVPDRTDGTPMRAASR